MHIAQYSNAYHPVVNGVVRSISAYRKALTALGHNVFIFAPEPDDYEEEEPFVFHYPSIKMNWPSDFPLSIPFSPFITQLLPALKLDIIHTHHPVLLGRTAARKAKELDLPFVFTFHSQYQEYSRYFPLQQLSVQNLVKDTIEDLIDEFLQLCNYIIVPSKSMLDLVVQEYGIEENISVLPTGIDLVPFTKVDRQAVRRQKGWGDEKVLVTIGRLAIEKNWETLLYAAAQVMTADPSVRYVIVGDGPIREDLESLAQELGIASRVSFAGKVSFKDVPNYLKAADLFIYASVTETQGLVTLEALAAGLPVVAVEAVGTSDVVEHKIEGILTANDQTELALAIKLILSDQALYQRCKEAALRKAQKYDINRQAEELLTIYTRTIEAKKKNQFIKTNKPTHAIGSAGEETAEE